MFPHCIMGLLWLGSYFGFIFPFKSVFRLSSAKVRGIGIETHEAGTENPPCNSHNSITFLFVFLKLFTFAGLVFCEALHLLFISLCLFTCYFILPSYLPLIIKCQYIQEKQFSLFLSFVFVYIWCVHMWCMCFHVCAHVHLLVLVRACQTYGGDNIGLILPSTLLET